MNINEVIGIVLLALGLIAFCICLVAFMKVMFGPTTLGKGKLEEINSLIQSWTALLKLLPRPLRGIFALLPFALILIGAGLYILIRKPI
jgi:hypothetical protein